MQKNRLIASTMTFRTFPLDKALDHLTAAGFDVIELCSVGSWVPHLDLDRLSAAYVSETAKMIASKGVKVHCLNVGDYTLEQMEYVDALAAETGAKIVTTPCGTLPEGADRAEFVKRRAERNAKLADLAERFGLTSSVEAPHKKTVAERPDEIDAYWSAQDPRVRCTFDTAHLTYAGEDMIPVAAKYAPRIAHSHLRDAVKGNSLMRYGEGIVDFAAYLAALDAGGYTGYFSMEYPGDDPETADGLLKKSAEFLSRFFAD